MFRSSVGNVNQPTVHHLLRISDSEFQWTALTYDSPIPVEFREWSFERQLDWSVRNYMPGQLEWLEDWMSAVNGGPPIPILVTRFEDFARDQRVFFRRISEFLAISEIRVPSLRWQSAAALRNCRRGSIDEWRDVLTAKQMSLFQDRVEPLCRHFGWEPVAPVWCSGKAFADEKPRGRRLSRFLRTTPSCNASSRSSATGVSVPSPKQQQQE
jgi:hypothetical protein